MSAASFQLAASRNPRLLADPADPGRAQAWRSGMVPAAPYLEFIAGMGAGAGTLRVIDGRAGGFGDELFVDRGSPQPTGGPRPSVPGIAEILRAAGLGDEPPADRPYRGPGRRSGRREGSRTWTRP